MKSRLVGLGIVVLAAFFTYLGPEWALLFILAMAIFGMFITFGGARIVIDSTACQDKSPTLFKYRVSRYGELEHQYVYAYDANTDDADPQTVHFYDLERNEVAIISHVSQVMGTKVTSEED
jgi:hypothetical protein